MADSFIRRFLKSRFKDGVLSPQVFICAEDDAGLSFHERDPPLDTHEGVLAYQEAFALPVSKHRMGVCVLREQDFGTLRRPSRKLPMNAKEAYAELHCETECPAEAQASHLAQRAIKLLDYMK